MHSAACFSIAAVTGFGSQLLSLSQWMSLGSYYFAKMTLETVMAHLEGKTLNIWVIPVRIWYVHTISEINALCPDVFKMANHDPQYQKKEKASYRLGILSNFRLKIFEWCSHMLTPCWLFQQTGRRFNLFLKRRLRVNLRCCYGLDGCSDNKLHYVMSLVSWEQGL